MDDWGDYAQPTSSEPKNFTASSSNSSNNNTEAGNFECNICLELAQDPIVTLCGHLYCWPCLYQWLHGHAHSSECPVCKAIIEEEKLVPLYGRGKNSTDPRSKTMPDVNIPHRPTGQRPPTAPQSTEQNFFGNANPWAGFMGGAPFGTTRLGNYTFSAAIGGLFPLLSFQVFPDATAYGATTGFPYRYVHTFHGGHVHGFPQHAPTRADQADNYLTMLFLMVGVLVVLSLAWF